MAAHCSSHRTRVCAVLLACSTALFLPSVVAQPFNATDVLGNGSGAPSGSSTANACTPSAGGNTCGTTGVASLGEGGSTGVGNPIHIVSGNKYQVEVDMPALPGELGLEVVRHYNSAHAGVAGLVGAGWRLSYETQLVRVGPTVQIVQADGGRHIFNVHPDNPSLCTSSRSELGRVHIEGTPAHPRYRWEWTHGEAAGRVLHFNARGLLERIEAASGATLNLQRSPDGSLLSVTDPQGRSLHLVVRERSEQVRAQAQNEAAFFAGIGRIRTPVGDVTYRFGQGSAAAAATLVMVASPLGQRRYHYEDSRHPGALTGISVVPTGEGTHAEAGGQTQRLRTWSYDERGHAKEALSATPDQPTLQVRIVRPALHTQDGLTWVRWQESGAATLAWQEALYRHRIVGGQYRLLEGLGAACATCSPTGVRYRYNEAGQLQEITRLSAVQVKDGRPLQIPRALEGVRHTHAAGTTASPVPTFTIERVRYADGREAGTEWLERQYFADARWPDKPTRLERPSAVGGDSSAAARWHTLMLSYNAAGQTTELTEVGYSPLTLQGELAAHPEHASRLERTQRWHYDTVAGVSVRVAHDGPLPNGPTGSPGDSDITRYQWDERGARLLQVEQSGGRYHRVAYTEQGWVSEVGLLEGGIQGPRTRFDYDSAGRLQRTARYHPGEDAPWEQRIERDSQGRITQVLHPTQPGANWAVGWSQDGTPQWWASAQGHWMRSTTSPQIEERPEASATRPAWATAANAVNAARPIDLAALHRHPPHSLALTDDFGRLVLRRNPNHGQHTMAYDEADRLTGMQDAMGHRARYRYDTLGRIVQQDVWPAAVHTLPGSVPTTLKASPQTTRWHYQGQCLVGLEHPEQSEHYRCNERGLRVQREVVLHHRATAPAHELRATTRYHYSNTGILVATQLPDGSTLHLQRDGLGRLSSLSRNRVHTPWLAALAPQQVLLHSTQHDMRGLARFTTGNGIQSEWQRSVHANSFGVLARTVHRRETMRRPAQILHARSTQDLMALLLGVRSVHANAPAPAGLAVGAPPGTLPGGLPGALGRPHDPSALLDQRYLWATSGELLLAQGSRLGQREQTAYAYDLQSQLVASVRSKGLPMDQPEQPQPPNQIQPVAWAEEWREQAVWRYAYGAQQRRLLAQQGPTGEGVPSQTLQAHTQVLRYGHSSAPSHRLRLGSQASAYNANGQPLHWAGQPLEWDALGRLVQVGEGPQAVARYRYDHRGLRIGKAVQAKDQSQSESQSESQSQDQPPAEAYTLYSQDHSLQAELNAKGRIARLYVWLSPQDTGLPSALPLAVIDSPAGTTLAPAQRSLWGHTAQAGRDMVLLVRLWLGHTAGEHTAYLHTNHLGAPELATDQGGQVIWQARYSPFGTAQDQFNQSGFTLHLRLPGQVWDEETGLHYNRQRYYDPLVGQYLTPDPLGIRLGNPDGPNPYAYVAYNPLRYIDPDGLILFAFDGTGNDESDTNELSNVVRFRNLYASDARTAFYITGVGTTDARSGIRNPWYLGGNLVDAGVSLTGKERVSFLINDLQQWSGDTPDETAIDIDVLGFSRGAAQARDFANQVASATTNNWYGYVDATGVRQCQRVNLRFMGLFDTVLSVHRGSYNLGIPEEFSHVAHAVALNEYRNLFPVESIAQGQTSAVAAGKVRIERGFLGAHSDIGGGFADGDLAKVALVWMVNQATAAGVQMDSDQLDNSIPANPVIHDSSSNLFARTGSAPSTTSEDRVIRFRDGSRPRQRTALVGTGTGYQDTIPFITYNENPSGNAAGTVDMNGYLQWLDQNGYSINMAVRR
jgi:RHS repeat-associated protein